MSAYAVALSASARKELARLPLAAQARFRRAIDELARDPLRKRPGADIRRLAASGAVWRLRVGAYRAIYTVDGNGVLVTRIGHRSTVYGR